MEDSPHKRATWRSALLNAASDQPSEVPAKLPLGREPSTGSVDWAHRCRVPIARLVPGDADPRLHALGLPRPRTADGWPMPFAGKDPDDPCALIRQFRQGVTHVVSEPANGHHHVLDGVMLDTRDYVGFVEPVWHLESARDSPGKSDAVHGRLEAAAVVNVRATETLFPRLAGRPRR